MRHGKKWKNAREKLDKTKDYPLGEAIEFLRENKTGGFDETLEVAVNLGVDPRKSDQSVRAAVVLPHGVGKKIRVLAFAQGDKAQAAKEAGADHVGAEELAEKIQGGWMDFDAVVATPDMMKVVGKLGKLLGPRGLMPNPKVGTVTPDIAMAVQEMKAGKVEFRTEKGAIIHAPLGKLSFDSTQLNENAKAFMDAVTKAKPSGAKGQYIKKITLSSTMGQGVRISPAEFR
ncbi:MAG: 50S ribosomal protein L1 [Chitinivibrionales bacterium]|nr:50S ribosomal protein L1 [Chitinivibrionales bacterium]MBD3396192.1 50S ribosomal protein L1 [Chitinivibrionales bacterium]